MFDYVVDEYASGGTYVGAYDEDGDFYSDCSVCLYDYEFIPPKDQIVVPIYKLCEEDYNQFISDLAEEVIEDIIFGPFNSRGRLIRLKSEYVKKDDDRFKEDGYEQMS